MCSSATSRDLWLGKSTRVSRSLRSWRWLLRNGKNWISHNVRNTRTLPRGIRNGSPKSSQSWVMSTITLCCTRCRRSLWLLTCSSWGRPGSKSLKICQISRHLTSWKKWARSGNAALSEIWQAIKSWRRKTTNAIKKRWKFSSHTWIR